MKKLVTILGARPQFVKAAAVSRILQKHNMQEVIVHTGQHFDANMSEVFFSEMDIPKPDYFLNINSLSHGAMTGRMLEEIEKVLQKEQPDIVMVYGDTNSTLAGALAAKKLNIKLAHVEAGLRSFNMNMPEEVNRILTDRISDYLFCPTQTAMDNLAVEGFDNIEAQRIHVGDVMYDAALFYEKKSNSKSDILANLNLKPENYILGTVHRQENTDNPERLSEIFEALNALNKEVQVVLPLHPRTQKIIAEQGIQLDFTPIEPVGYFDIIQLLKNCRFVMTDSGGMQKEAFFFKKYCLTLRDETEWIELVENKVNFLVGASKDIVLNCYRNMESTFPQIAPLYGQGNASEKIVTQLLSS